MTATSTGRRLVLCFDGTGNAFHGDSSDTNVVKIYQMLDRDSPNQFHYYQPGIGTYSEGKISSPNTPLRRFLARAQAVVDQAIGSSFADHVTSGYRFLMRYYSPGDSVYIFGFSRGAYTARFLAEMVHTVGLLSRGNEEMVRFAWRTFAEFQQSRGKPNPSARDLKHGDFMVKFKKTFCRPHVNIHFLGLFDCVNSVGQFEVPLFRKSFEHMSTPAATHIRHAVSIHERRVKFKPALFLLDDKKFSNDVVEIWFAGNHGDVGGGWQKSKGEQHLLSDTPLLWMIHEVLNLKGSEPKLAFRTRKVEHREKLQGRLEGNLKQTFAAATLVKPQNFCLHDMLAVGGGVAWLMTMIWWVIEILPIFTRLELEKGKWVPRYWPPNLGAPRDIPHRASIHKSVYELRQAGHLTEEQMPKLGGDNPHVNVKGALNAWAKGRSEAQKLDLTDTKKALTNES
ncbi:hypothetical protein ACN47E_001568 [Coniothyrium glycines]